jgi:hypothetical protein
MLRTHLLAEIVRLDRAHHRPAAGDSPSADAIKLVARAHQSMIWDRSRQVLRLRAALREFFPAALEALADLDAPDTLELLGAAPDPDQAAALSRAAITAALRRANGRGAAARAAQIQAVPPIAGTANVRSGPACSAHPDAKPSPVSRAGGGEPAKGLPMRNLERGR